MCDRDRKGRKRGETTGEGDRDRHVGAELGTGLGERELGFSPGLSRW